MKARLAAVLLPAFLAGCLAGQPDTEPVPTGQIDGAVVDHLLRPYPSHTVHLVQLGRTDDTSAFGGFAFRAVPTGLYTLTTSLPTGESVTQAVEVQEDRVTRVILQLVPAEGPLPYFDAYSFTSLGEKPQAGAECGTCEWAVPLEADPAERPAEITLEAVWDPSLVLGNDRDHLDIVITDGRGFPLYKDTDLASPFRVSILGTDLHPEATELRVHVTYGRQFLPSAQDFTMHSVMTLYHGATKDAMFRVGP